MKVRKTLDKGVRWQIGESHYSAFLRHLSHKYTINCECFRTPTTDTLEKFYKAQTEEDLLPLMMQEFLSNQ